MSTPALKVLLNYWEELRNGRVAPLRSEIDPRAFESALQHTFVIERVERDNFRFRLAGMKLCDYMGMELRGMPATALIEHGDRSRFQALLEGFFTKPGIVQLELRVAHQSGNTIPARMLLLPMRGHDGKINRVLGGLTCDGPPTSTPTRFAITDLNVSRIVATKQRQQSVLQPGFAQDSAGFTHRATTVPKGGGDAARRPYLRLVASND